MHAIGEWWNNDVEEIENQGNKMGLPPNMSDAHSINGKPGPLFPVTSEMVRSLAQERKRRG